MGVKALVSAVNSPVLMGGSEGGREAVLFQLGLAVRMEVLASVGLGNCEGLCANYWQLETLRLAPQ